MRRSAIFYLKNFADKETAPNSLKDTLITEEIRYYVTVLNIVQCAIFILNVKQFYEAFLFVNVGLPILCIYIPKEQALRVVFIDA